MKKTLLALTAVTMLSPVAAFADRTGQEVYNTKCTVCHASGAAGAPKFGDVAAWAPRAALGVDALLATAKTGKGAMPPKGLCMDCSDEELKAAIDYLLDNAK